MELDAGNICGNGGSFDRCDDAANNLNFRRIRRYFAFAIGNDSEAKPSREFVERRIKYKSIDLKKWKPDLEFPEQLRLAPTSNSRVLHSHFLKESGGAWQERNIKGSPIMSAAVEQLAAEGLPVESLSIEDVPARAMRFYQAQADITECGLASRRFAEAHFNPAANALARAELLQAA